MRQRLHLLTPSGALSLWLCRLSHTHTNHQIKRCWKDSGSALTVRLATPLIGAVNCYQFGGAGLRLPVGPGVASSQRGPRSACLQEGC